MSIDKVLTSATTKSQAQGSHIFFPGQDDFASTLTLGQVIKAKVLRHHEGSRYAATIGGQEKIIDSANPLKPGDTIEGRVTALGKQVEVKKLHTFSKERPASTVEQDGLANLFVGRYEKQLKTIQQFFSSRQSSITNKDIQILKEFLSRGIGLKALLLAALSLKKAGAELTKTNVESIVNALQQKEASKGLRSTASITLEADINQVQSAQTQWQNAKALADDIYSHSALVSAEQSSLGNATSDNDSMTKDQSKALPYQLLNVQDEGTINHQLMVFPIWLGGKLIEVNMAFFDQPSLQSNTGEHLYKRFVFTLQLEQLGRVIASAIIYGTHVHLVLTTEDAEATTFLAKHMGALANNIENLGWSIDKVEYATAADIEFEPAVSAVVDHYISKDSLSRVF